jgi:hypothetical protein
VLLLIMVLFNLAPTDGTIGSLARSVSAVSADLPWWQEALRLPASIFAPASSLPVWGALAQVAVIGSVAESLLGWRRMALVGMIANAAATASARAMAWLGPHNPLGISGHTASLPDTGPSVFVTAVLVYLAVTYRTPILLYLTTVTMVAEAAITPNLAGREHLVGMATAAALAAAHRVTRPNWSLSPAALPAWASSPTTSRRLLRYRDGLSLRLPRRHLTSWPERVRHSHRSLRGPQDRSTASAKHTNSSSTRRYPLHGTPIG